jgi:hypothetical protein
MPRATVVLELVNLVNTRIPPGGTAPGQMLVFTDDITKINNKPVAAGVSQHSGFVFVFASLPLLVSQIYGCVKPDTSCRVSRTRRSGTAVTFMHEHCWTSLVAH